MPLERCLGREAPLPDAMQGHWVDADDPAASLLIDGGEVVCFGKAVDYRHKLVARIDGALTVSLKAGAAADADLFERTNITELVITPEGTFHACNVNFGCEFVRADG